MPPNSQFHCAWFKYTHTLTHRHTHAHFYPKRIYPNIQSHLLILYWKWLLLRRLCPTIKLAASCKAQINIISWKSFAEFSQESSLVLSHISRALVHPLTRMKGVALDRQQWGCAWTSGGIAVPVRALSHNEFSSVALSSGYILGVTGCSKILKEIPSHMLWFSLTARASEGRN